MKGSNIRLFERNTGWYIQEYHKILKEWHDKAGPCLTKKACEQRKLFYLKSIDDEFYKRIGDQVMSKPWGEVKI